MRRLLSQLLRRLLPERSTAGAGPSPDAGGVVSESDVPGLKLVVGLGNPGARYGNTRHNAGYLVVDRLAQRHGLRFTKSKQFESCRWGAVTLVKPTSFMNASGGAVQAAVTKSRARVDQIVVVHDDLDLPLGRLRFKRGGGAGGQRGVQDTIERLGPEFWRLKIGVSRPPTGWRADKWVLSRFADDEKELVADVVEAAADALELAARDGLEAAMNVTNGTDLNESR